MNVETNNVVSPLTNPNDAIIAHLEMLESKRKKALKESESQENSGDRITLEVVE